jgi:hypothetical protein
MTERSLQISFTPMNCLTRLMRKYRTRTHGYTGKIQCGIPFSFFKSLPVRSWMKKWDEGKGQLK